MHLVLSPSKIIFIIIPLMIMLVIALYTGVIYYNWLSDKDEALNRLSKYKRLIDRTEELRGGYIYSYSDIDLASKVVDIPTRIYDRNNDIIGEFFEQKREIVPYSHIPPWLIKAVIASEDRAFYRHRGISYRGILRALVINLTHFRVVQGGSTITQQLAKVLFTDMERSLKRKIYELFCAFDIERRYDKQDILSMYLNLIYFGNGAYGVESASKMFFGSSVRELNETECAMIVATISNPSIYSPLANLSSSLDKTRRIMKSMVDSDFISEGMALAQFKRFLVKWDFALDVYGKAESSMIGSFLFSSYRINRAPFFNEQIRRIIVEKFGEDVVKKGGLSVYTTIDSSKQDVAVEELREGILKQREFHHEKASVINDNVDYKIENEKAGNIEGAFVSLNPFTGEIISYVGGYSFSSKNQLDHVSQIRRQPGSSFKPVIYAAAFESMNFTPSTVFIDEKTVFEDEYSPKNYNDQHIGSIILREALRKSINVIAVKLLDRIGYDAIFGILKKGLGLSEEELGKRFGRTLSLALGTYEISPMESCILHSLLVNGGNYIKPFGVRFVKDYNGNVVWDNEGGVMRYVEERRRRYERIVDRIACAITVSILKGVFEEGGTAYHAVLGKRIGFPIAGKTGTSSDFNDAWFVGYTHDLVTVIWIGNNKGAISLGEGRAGGVVAAPIWVSYVSRIYNDRIPGDFLVPDDGISFQTICLDSGLVPREDGSCPRVSIDELYYSGTEPGEYCNIHMNK
ncbi:MAG: transglycosylase domain-containing protein [Spirochaetota bacterium]|nr:transglycosylase domain-containing protein [Spirochaetota bacterium]